MKKLSIVLLVLLIFGLESCSNWLDLKPESQIVLEDFWQTESQATAVLAGCYSGLIADPCIERMIVWGELRSDNLVAGNTILVDMLNVLNVNITPSNPYANWSSFYSVINNCNTFLYYAPSVVNKDPNFTETKLHTMEAEALTLRALSYFYLVRAFKEVPLILNPSISDAQNYKVPKSTERVILDQIISDLLTAQKNAKSSYGTEAFDKGRITVNGINALLADVYLWDQQYQKCADMCDLVMADKTLKLVNGDRVLTDVFYTGNSTESIFELQFDKNAQNNNEVNSLYGINGQPGHLAYASYLVKKGTLSPFNYQPTTLNESQNDIRQSNSIGAASNGNGFMIYKYSVYQCVENTDGTVTPNYRSSGTTPNWILYRLSDVILMKAEAMAQLDRSDDDLKESLKLVNTTYLRSNVTADSLSFNNYSDKSSIQDLVLRERQRELLFEGKRWFDLMRLVRRTNTPSVMLKYLAPKLTGDAMQVQKMSVMNALYMPILQSELQINTSLTQNPFYVDTNLTSN